ncbi:MULTISPECIES: phosphohistidine phosphatase SixA [Glaesserella]|uniref:Phosphohistidine phosphatase SixA n=1 Tax=Glaesserella australis TaxID=2094024 RepID=A0A328BZ14_9PAST|nr:MULTISPECIES: phosphohistidine phosphatase SixA [Glaesserella]AUI65958.1 phosphohistidine phosphatase SixA [Glaesserella sp. 15-184]RAL18322.1 phosphohistidine phosphatase SixA [Glaesserella australis]
MNIWIMRHGEASFHAKTDNERPLTENGHMMAFEQGKKLGEIFNNQKIKLDKVIVSPYLRAQQTKENVFKGLQAVGFVQSFANIEEIWEEITPSGNPNIVVDYLHFLREEGAQNILIISHLPLVFDLVYHLTKHNVNFYPAVIAEIEWKQDVGKVIDVVYP